MWKERSDALETGYHIPLDRYDFAIRSLRKAFEGINLQNVLVADASSGAGYGSKKLSDSFFRVISFDISDEALDYSNQKYPGIAQVKANVEIQKFRGFDALVCIETLEHLIDPYTFLKNLEVKHLVISTTTSPAKHYDEWHKHDFTVEQFREMLTPKYKIIDEMHQVAGEEEYHIIYAQLN